jgi:urease accessory protein
MPGAEPAPAAARGWQASLALTFGAAEGRTTLIRRDHRGPLVVQKPLYPEGHGVCQCIVVHPPGGIAGGDELQLDVTVEPGAHAQLTTPGAAKWYRAGGRPAHQRTVASVGAGARLEWMPQGTIVFDGADAASDLRVDLAADATFIGWDVVCLGRTAAAERFAAGTWRQRVDVRRDSALIWSERAIVRGGSALLQSRVGLYEAPVFGTFVVMGAGIDDNVLAACRAVATVRGEGAVTRLPDALVARYRGDASEAGHAYFGHLWSLVRPAVVGREAVPPRIWRT